MDKDPKPEAHSPGGKDGVPAPAKKPYRTPRLTSYGDLRRLALGRGGQKFDGWFSPKSRD